LREVIVPASGAGDGADAESSQAAKIFGGGGRRGEFEGGRGPGERVDRERGNVGAGETGDDGETVLRREMFHEAAHFAVTDDGERDAHAGGAPVVRSWRTMRA